VKIVALVLALLLLGCSSPAQETSQIAVATPPPEANPNYAKFTAEVEHGRDFQRAFGRGLLFQLAANRDPSTPGWIIEIRVEGSTDSEVELAGVATPPFRGFNPRYSDVSYGNSAAHSVAMNPRRFSFLENPADFPSEIAAVRKVLWPPNEAEFKAALEQIGQAPQCEGILRVLDHRLSTPSAATIQRIEWLKFEVELCPTR
jgi:hypothetical protein